MRQRHLYAGPSYVCSACCIRQRVARSSRRQYLPKVLHVFYVGAQQQAAVRGVVLQQLRAAVLRDKRHRQESRMEGRGVRVSTLSKKGLLKLR